MSLFSALHLGYIHAWAPPYARTLTDGRPTHFSVMDSARRARLEYRTSEENKEKLRQYAEDHGKSVNDILDEWVQERLDAEQPTDPTETEAKRVEKALCEWENKHQKLDNLKGVGGLEGDGAMMCAGFLAYEAYKELKTDWQKIRFQALQDFRAESRPAWMQEWGIRSEQQIIEICRWASDFHEATVKRDELRLRLNTLYRTLSRVQQMKSRADPTET
jgi:hypothetical protein